MTGGQDPRAAPPARPVGPPARPPGLSPAQQALLARLAKGARAAPVPSVPRAAGDGPFPLSYAQDRVWFTSQLAPDLGLFNLMGGILLPGPVRAAELEARLGATIRRHDVLRMSVRVIDDEPRAVLAPSVPAVIPVIDHSGDSAADAGALARQAVLDVAAPAYQLDRAPLWRLALVRLPGGEHMLVMGGHHLVLDGPSLPMLGRELLAPTGRPGPPVRYVDFASWQKGPAWRGGIADELAYWRQELAGLPAPLDLAFGRRRQDRRSLRGATIAADVPGDTLRRIRELSRAEGVTLYTAFLAAFVTLLHRYTGQDDILVGASMSGRTMPELTHMLGMFVNMVPLRAKLAGRPSFLALLASMKQTLAAALSRPDVPFELLVNELRLGGGRGHPPLVQVGFNMPMAEIPSLVRVVDIPFTAEGSQLDLTVHVQSSGGDGLRLLFEYSCDLFSEADVRYLIGRYLLVLDGVTADPGRVISEVPLLRGAERAVLVSGAGQGLGQVPGLPARTSPNAGRPGTCPSGSGETGESTEALAPLHVLVAEQARRTPDRAAVVSGEQTLTYGELDLRASSLARRLRRLGVSAETLVGVFLRPGAGLVVALLGIWKAGGAFVPLDPEQPSSRTSMILEDTAAPVVVTERELAGSVGARALCVEDVPDDRGRAPEVAVSGGNVAYVMYTSGSTGRPKGVVISHGGIANRVLWTVREHGIGPGDQVLAKTRITFDAAVWEVFAPLVGGGVVVMAPAGADQDPRALLRAVGEHRVTVLQVVPSVLRLLAGEEWAGCEALRLLFSAGEPLSGELCARVSELTSAQIINTYGPAECAIDVTSARYVAGHSGVVPIGRPIDRVRVLVLDPALEPVPAGVPGELYVGGAGVGRGYLGRPELTAAAFVADPHGTPGGRLYRTGDLARWRGDGELEFLGRRDHQVKVNGVRVELGEVETALAACPGVRGAVVTAPGDRAGGPRLVGYVAGDVSTGELRAFLRERLPRAMIPGLFVRLDAIPLNSNGKVDRAALPDTGRGPAPELADGRGYRAPRGHVEETIAALWSELLDGGPAGAGDDFFALGGHSLLLTRLAAGLRSRLGANLTVAELFGAPTLEEQARLVTASRAAGLEPIRPAGRGGPLPLSPGQRRLWFLHQLDRGDINYNVPVALRLSGELDVPALQAALDAIVERHEVLRTTIAAAPDGDPVQVIHPPAPVPLARADLSGLPAEQARARSRSLLEADACRPFDLAAGPVLRIQLIRVAPGEHVLGMTFHHIASDGWSAGVFRQELAALYAASRAGRPSPLPPLPIQYADYAAWQHRFLSGERVRQQLGYWRARLAGLPALTLPASRPRPARISPAAAYCLLRVPAGPANQLRALGRRAGTSLFMTLLAGFHALLARYTGQEDIVTGTAAAGRSHPETERLIGFFVNTLVLRADLSGDPTVIELLARIREVTLGAYAHQDLPFEHLVEDLQPARDLGRHPLFQIMFEMVTPEEDAPLPGLRADPLWEETLARTAKFDLTLAVEEQGDGSLTGYVEYAADLFDQGTIERMLAHYEAVLAEFASHPDRRLSGIEMTSPAERAQLSAWATGPALGAGPLVPELLARQAGATPDAVALIAGDRSLTYAGLSAEAGSLAGRLAARGAGPETVVGLCLDDGPAFIVAALAVLGAGAAYLPLDPAHPGERLRFMLRDAGASLVVTTVSLRDRVPAGAGPAVLVLDEDDQAADGPPLPRPLAANTAYVIYTSGSTGSAKAVTVSQLALASSTAARQHYYRDPVGTFLLLSPVTFDSSVAGIFWTLCSGGTLLLPAPGRRLADEVARDIAARRVTHVVAVPSLLAQVADWQLRASRPPLDSLRVIISAGEAFPAGLAERLAAVAPHAALYNEYGPTEAGVWASAARVSPDAGEGPGAAPPIGTPIPNAVCHVLDGQLRPVPAGVPGELHLGGAALARGYRGRPSLTAERFVASPLSADGSRLYRTGDLARWRPDGQLEYLGRIDDQVKIAGYRVEPGEIEATLRQHPQVAAAAVVAPGQAPEERRLVAYVVASGPAGPATPVELRAFCRARLPEYLIPASFVAVDALPLTSTGKVDRRALLRRCGAEPEDSGPRAGDEPRTEVERQVAGVWRDVLGLDRIGRHDDFFVLGGHSLQAVRISTRLQELYDIELPLRRLFEATTVAKLAAALEEAITAEVAALSDAEIEAMLAEPDLER